MLSNYHGESNKKYGQAPTQKANADRYDRFVRMLMVNHAYRAQTQLTLLPSMLDKSSLNRKSLSVGLAPVQKRAVVHLICAVLRQRKRLVQQLTLKYESYSYKLHFLLSLNNYQERNIVKTSQFKRHKQINKTYNKWPTIDSV